MPRARLGQHFLVDPGILERIVTALEPTPQDTVVEVGAGRGTLTRQLAPRVARVIAIEKDPRLVAGGEWGPPVPDNVTVLCADALALDWHRDLPLPIGARFKVVGNIPYYITSALIEKALTPPLPVLVAFLVQREVADRLSAAPGSKAYGALSAGVQSVADVERVLVVKAGAFRPRPRVDSALVRLRPRAAPMVSAHEQARFRAFVTALFSHRRKQLGRTVRSMVGADKTAVDRWLTSNGVEPEQRPEELAPQDLVRLFRALPLLTGEPGDR